MIKSVYDKEAGLSMVNTGSAMMFQHCGTLFVGEKCPDCGELISAERLVLTQTTAHRLWAMGLGNVEVGDATVEFAAAPEVLEGEVLSSEEATESAAVVATAPTAKPKRVKA